MKAANKPEIKFDENEKFDPGLIVLDVRDNIEDAIEDALVAMMNPELPEELYNRIFENRKTAFITKFAPLWDNGIVLDYANEDVSVGTEPLDTDVEDEDDIEFSLDDGDDDLDEEDEDEEDDGFPGGHW